MSKDRDYSYIVVLVTVPGRQEGLMISERVVKEGLCACCNLLEGLTSVFAWEGKIEKDKECLIIMKTTAALFESLVRIIEKIHPYDVPEIIAMPIVSGNPAYLKWIDQVTRA
jgi:periplasmic divalent cation tolerance protein